MESWRKVWREGVAPVLSTRSLKALHKALLEDDLRLLQGATFSPPPLQWVQNRLVYAACPLAYCGVVECGGFAPVPKPLDEEPGKLGVQIGDVAGATVAQVEEFFAAKCFEIDQRLGEPAGCRWFLNWVDETPRDEMRKELAREIELELRERWGTW